MELYIIKSGLCLAILFGFYKLFLENENMHIFKRFYLLGALLLSFLIPLLTFKIYVEIPVTTPSVFMDSGAFSVTEIESPTNYWPSILWTLYALGVVFFSLKFGKNLNQLISKIRNNPKFTMDSIQHVLLKTHVIPHTFLNYVFLNKQKFEAKEIPEEVIQHEHVHAIQKHSIDILFVELLQIVFWFNPFLHFIKRSIKLNHEFLADRAVLNQGTDITAYQKLLLAFSSDATTPTLANSINYSFIKKRFTVMKKQTSTQAIWLRSLLLLPLFALLLYGFSTKEVVPKQIFLEENEIGMFQEKATPKMIKEYNDIAKKWNDPNATSFTYLEGEKERALYIYNLMSDSQKRDAEPFPIRITQLLQNTQASPSLNAPPFPKNLTALIEDIKNKNGVFYYGTQKITYEKALEVAQSKNYKMGIRTDYAEKIPELYLLKAADSQIAPPSPPAAPAARQVGEVPPVPPVAPISLMDFDVSDFVNETIKNRGEFYIEDKKVNSTEFLETLTKLKESKQNYCINLDKSNTIDRLSITMQN